MLFTQKNTPGRPRSLKCRLCRVRPEEEAEPGPTALFIGGFLCLFGLPETLTSPFRRLPNAEDAPSHSGYPPPLLKLIFSCRTSTRSLLGFPSHAVGLGKPCSPRRAGASPQEPVLLPGKGLGRKPPSWSTTERTREQLPLLATGYSAQVFPPPAFVQIAGRGGGNYGKQLDQD